MSHFVLRCMGCGASRPPDMEVGCAGCGSPCEVVYTEPRRTGAQPTDWDGPPVPMPVHDPASFTSMGEGSTACVGLTKLGASLGLERLTAKLEIQNPTGSYKDRGSVVLMAAAREHGVCEVVEDSSGNAGASVSAYAARAGIRAHVFAPSSVPSAKAAQIRVYGASLHLIDGPREAATEAALAWVDEHGIVYASHNLSPYFIEGTKVFAYEVFMQLGRRLPDHLVIPVGNGSLYRGAWNGFREMREAGLVDSVPRLHCVQARAFMPVVAAYMGEDWSPDGRGTVAGGIASVDPPHKQAILRALRASGGSAAAVDDDSILESRRLLAEMEGIYAEPTSAAAFAGLSELVRSGVIGRSDHVLVPVTGSGLKDTPPS